MLSRRPHEASGREVTGKNASAKGNAASLSSDKQGLEHDDTARSLDNTESEHLSESPGLGFRDVVVSIRAPRQVLDLPRARSGLSGLA
jgi:hypothetical protein